MTQMRRALTNRATGTVGEQDQRLDPDARVGQNTHASTCRC